MAQCPLCEYELEGESDPTHRADWLEFHCPNCGCFQMSFESMTNLPALAAKDRRNPLLLSHAVRKMNSRTGRRPTLSRDLIEKIAATTELPTAIEQVENLLLWMANNSTFGERTDGVPETHSAIVGNSKPEGLAAAAEALIRRDYAEGVIRSGVGFRCKLTLAGWQAVEELKRGRSDSRKAFMAMAYGDPELDAVFAECFKPAVKATGFSLQRLDESPSAGLIDDRLRVEIRTSRFVVVDLTGDNQGAYWEAGFAEGIGRPVIYTCEKGYFKKPGTHFDTDHQHTIRWERDNLDAAFAALKTTIRATLPAEAVLEDED